MAWIVNPDSGIKELSVHIIDKNLDFCASSLINLIPFVLHTSYLKDHVHHILEWGYIEWATPNTVRDIVRVARPII